MFSPKVIAVAILLLLAACGGGGGGGGGGPANAGAGGSTSSPTSAGASGPALVSARLTDQDGSGGASAGDTIVLRFDRDIDATGLTIAAVRVLSPLDSLGAGATAAPGVVASEAVVALGTGALLSLYETYRVGAAPGANRSPAAVSVDPGAVRGTDGTPGRVGRPVPVLLDALLRAKYQPEQWRGPFSPFLGQMHAHTSYSDGEGLPLTAYDMARGYGLDWFVVSDHLEFFPIQPWKWASKKQHAESRTIDGSFVAMWGYEWGSGLRNPLGPEMYNHVNILSDRMVDLFSTFALSSFYGEIAKLGDDPICKFNHPAAKNKGVVTYNNWDDYRYDAAADRYFRYVRVITGSNNETEGYVPLLDHGWHVAPGFGEDNHGADWGHSEKRTGVFATALTRDEIKAGLRARRTFTTSDRDAWVRLMADDPAGDLWMGSTVCGPGAVILEIEGGDPTDPIDTLEIISSGGTPAFTVTLGGVTSFAVDWTTDPTDDAYYWVKLTQPDGDVVYSAPIFVDR